MYGHCAAWVKRGGNLSMHKLCEEYKKQCDFDRTTPAGAHSRDAVVDTGDEFPEIFVLVSQ